MQRIHLIRRFLVPSPIVTLICFLKFRCRISMRAEVELSPRLTIGKGTNISSFTKIKSSNGPIMIGENVQIAAGCDISTGPGGVTIGDSCLIGPHAVIVAVNYKYDNLALPIGSQGLLSKGITIGDNVWLGAGACILDGAAIGKNVIVGPNSVVSAKIPDNAIVQGNPAKIIFIRR